MKKVLLLIMFLATELAYAELLIEPIAGKTASFDRVLEDGEVISLSSIGLKENEIFRFHKCGPNCNSASPYKVYPEDQFTGKWSDIFEVETGKYYFWLENTKGKTKKYGYVVKPTKLEKLGNSYILEFESGSIVTINLKV